MEKLQTPAFIGLNSPYTDICDKIVTTAHAVSTILINKKTYDDMVMIPIMEN